MKYLNLLRTPSRGLGKIRIILPMLALAAVLFFVATPPERAEADSHLTCDSIYPVCASLPSGVSQLTETNLNGAKIILGLRSGTWNTSPNIANFAIHQDKSGTAFSGVSVTGATRDSGNKLTLTLSYSGDFDADKKLFVNALAAAHSGSNDKLSHDVSVYHHDVPTAVHIQNAYQRVRSDGSTVIEVHWSAVTRNTEGDTTYVPSYDMEIQRVVPGVNESAPVDGRWEWGFYATLSANPDPEEVHTGSARVDPGEYRVRMIAITYNRGTEFKSRPSANRKVGVDHAVGKVTGIQVTPGPLTDESTITWVDVPDAARYRIQYTTDDNFDSPTEASADNLDQEAKINGLLPGRDYRLRMFAVAQHGREGPPSDVVEFTSLDHETSQSQGPPEQGDDGGGDTGGGDTGGGDTGGGDTGASTRHLAGGRW